MSPNQEIGICVYICLFIVLTILVINNFLDPIITTKFNETGLNYSTELNNSEVIPTKMP